MSVTTVSRALKDGPEVRPKTKQMVLEAAERLDYIPHQGGVFLRTGKTNTIALILSPEPQSAFPTMGYMYYCQGILRMLADSHFTLSIHPRLPHEDLLRLFSESWRDGKRTVLSSVRLVTKTPVLNRVC